MADPYSLIINGERVFWRIHTIQPFIPVTPTMFNPEHLVSGKMEHSEVSYLVKGVDDQGIEFSLECSANQEEYPLATFYHPAEKGNAAAAHPFVGQAVYRADDGSLVTKDGDVVAAATGVVIRWGDDGPIIMLGDTPLEVLSVHHDQTFKVRYQGEIRTVVCHGSSFADGTGDLILQNVALSRHPHGVAGGEA